MIADAVLGALAAGRLHRLDQAAGGLAPRLAITAEGRRALADLLARPLPSLRGPAGRTRMTLWVSFLGGVAPAVQGRAVAAMRHALADELAALRGCFGRCPVPGTFARRWLDREAARIAADLAWLDALAGTLSGN